MTMPNFKALCEGATPRPWAWSYLGEKVNGYILGTAFHEDETPYSGRIEHELMNDGQDEEIVYGECVGEHEAATCNYNNPRFIALAVSRFEEAVGLVEDTLHLVRGAVLVMERGDVRYGLEELTARQDAFRASVERDAGGAE